MLKSLFAAFILQLVFSNEAKLRGLLQKESFNGQTALFLRELLLRQEHQGNAIEKMKEKWRELFNTDDLNKDGVITLAERDRRIQIFIDIDTIYLEQMLRISFHCAYFSFGGNESAIAINEFLDGMENAYKNDSSKLLTKIRKCNELYFLFVDVNGDKRLSWQEYKDFFSKAYEIETYDLKTDFIRWNPRISVDKFVDANDKNGDLKITWEENKDFHNHNSGIVSDKLKDDFLGLNPYILEEGAIDAWTAFGTDDRDTTYQVQEEMSNGIFVQPKKPRSP